jgi:hypothetical protein
MSAQTTKRTTRISLLFLAHVGGDTFSVEDAYGGVSLVNGATLKMLLNQAVERREDDNEVGGGTLG